MPLKPGKNNIGPNISELSNDPHHAKMANKFGEAKAHKIDVAIAMYKASHDCSNGGCDRPHKRANGGHFGQGGETTIRVNNSEGSGGGVTGY